jgi:DMSO/TMAO reductase YedYZ molybdopterin-dependent catalytic subunit
LCRSAEQPGVRQNAKVRNFRGAWPLAGFAAGMAGLATSYFAAMAMTIRESPVVAVAELVIKVTPGWLAEFLIRMVGELDKPLLLLGIFVTLAVAFASAGGLARRSWWAPAIVFVGLAGIAAVGVGVQRGATTIDQLPVAVGLVTWLVTLSLLTEPLRNAELEASPTVAEPIGPDAPDTVELVGGPDAPRGDHSRRTFLLRAGLVAAGAAVLGITGRVIGSGRRHVEESRRLLRLRRVSQPAVPPGAQLDVRGITPWRTSADDFYRIHTAIVVPAIEPATWALRIHGMVEQELTLTFDDLVTRELTESWITLNCVSNEVGGSLIGNAWWSGVRLADLLQEARPHAQADAVLQTSEDGWTCGTPLAALTDERDAMLAVAMNGGPLPIEHGFPVRTIVPGLYGYVSACKWVVDLEVTRFEDINAYWTQRGWTERGPVKMSSRVDVPRSGSEVPGGEVRLAGVAWSQHTGVSAVEFSIDDGDWEQAELARVPSEDTWVQWRASASVDRGDHLVRVRATDTDGNVQTGEERDVFPDGSTGWHAVDFSAS